jgi:hypothetical protein
MSVDDSDRTRRRFLTDDPADHRRLEYAWMQLEQVLENGETAAQLDSDDLDHVIADLVGIRHRRLPGGSPTDGFKTVIREGEGWMVLESYIEEEHGDEIGPLPSDDRI